MYEERIISFVDILGFKEMVKNNSAEYINRILSIPKDYFDKQPEEKYKDIQISMFSDSIIISFVYTIEHAVYTLLLDLENILIEFILEGVICRGSIVKGEVFHNKDFLFGPAFINAYELEKNMKNPKIGFSKEIYDIGCKYHHPKNTNKQEEYSLKTLFMDDEDGYYYIDYFFTPVSSVRDVITVNKKEYLTKMTEIIIKGLSSGDSRIRDKYCWASSKFEIVLKYIPKFSDEIYELLFKDITKDEVEALLEKIEYGV